jgi:hypothetical protein
MHHVRIYIHSTCIIIRINKLFLLHAGNACTGGPLKGYNLKVLPLDLKHTLSEEKFHIKRI